MKKLPLIAILFAALSLSGAAQAHTSASTQPSLTSSPGTPVIETPACDSQQSPQLCAAQEDALTQDATVAAPPPAKNSRHDAAAQPVPEPQTFAMILIGLVLLGFTSRRQEAYEKFSD